MARSHGLLDYDASHTSNTTESDPGEPSFTFDTVSCNDVRKVIMAMPSNKVPGYERVPLFVIKDCLPHIQPTFTGPINSSLANSVLKAIMRSLTILVPLVAPGPLQGDRKDRLKSI